MIRIIVMSKLDHTVVTIEHDRPTAGSAYGRSRHWTPIGYTVGPAIAHDETGVIRELVADALQRAEERAGSIGGWSVLS